MSTSSTRDIVKVIVDGEEVPGLIAYGLVEPGRWVGVPFPSTAWAGEPEVEPYVLHGDGWRIVLWEFEIVVWPAPREFSTAIRTTLRTLIEAGSRVAWVGCEGLPFCDPPGLWSG